MRTAVAVLAVGALALGGCVMRKASVYEPITEGLETMKGRDVAVAYRTLGLPDRKETVGRKMLFVWNRTRCDVLMETDLDGVVVDSTMVGRPGACRWVSKAMKDFMTREAAKAQ
ncbi:hypothetical protein GVN21_17670 [Caulobacter sp. SLTY]|uniref:hypothetical protein n=1 Tax=Caulobacter sp. SLTY TaxID=2683262 RepID=UPI0014135FCA|nr:hypothetical protein [Caulobacter sp. SLTY]NBB17197.1 hypothetical protein [Caulobacter sp. SLTY]